MTNKVMTGEDAIKIWQYVKDHPTYDGEIVPIIQEACDIAIQAIEKISHLEDRPCAVCEFHTEQGCGKWNCVFD